jgi:hypothetical protein
VKEAGLVEAKADFPLKIQATQGFKIPASDGPRIAPMPLEAKAVEAVAVLVPKQKPPKKPPAPNNKLARQQQEMREAALEAMPPIKKTRYSKKEAAWILGMCVSSLEYRIRNSEIEMKRDGRRRYITQAEIDRYNKRDHNIPFRPPPQ